MPWNGPDAAQVSLPKAYRSPSGTALLLTLSLEGPAPRKQRRSASATPRDLWRHDARAARPIADLRSEHCSGHLQVAPRTLLQSTTL